MSRAIVIERLRQEDLAAAWLDNLSQQSRQADPLHELTVVVQHAGLGRWLRLWHARQTGISAGLQMPFPRAFILQFLRTAGLADPVDSLDARGLRWLIFRLLHRAVYREWGEAAWPLMQYLKRDHPQWEIRCWQLAVRLADLYDQYAIYRPQWLMDWLDSPATEHPLSHGVWQARLYHALPGAAGLSVEDWKARVIGLALQRYLEQGSSAALPEESPLHVYGIGSFPAPFLAFFDKLSEQRPVVLYQLVCSKAYLGDLGRHFREALSRAEAAEREEQLAPDLHNPLLVASGQAAARFQSLLIECGFSVGDLPDQEREPATDLEALQASLALDQPWTDRFTADGTLSIHSCHSQVREVEVLQQQLLALLAAYPDLEPEEILVMAPEIETYADAIEAVFGQPVTVAGRAAPIRLPYCLADRASDVSVQCFRFVELLMAFLKGRQTFNELAALLDFEPVMQQLGMGREEMRELLEVLYRSGIRWGIDAPSRQQAGHPAFDAYSWDQGLRRLMDGLIHPENEIVSGLIPMPVPSRLAELLGRLMQWLRPAFALVKQRQETLAFSRWSELWLRVVREALGESSLADLWYAVLLPEMGALAQQAEDTPITFATFARIVLSAQPQPAGAGGILRQGITFCRMQPVRHIPARVLCILGLDEGAYPRQVRRDEFNLMEQQLKRVETVRGTAWEPDLRVWLGDPRPREEDRQLFIDCLMNARQMLYLSYVGQSQRDNQPRPPSVLLSELEQFLRLPAQGEDAAVRSRHVDRARVVHPLQEWSMVNFRFPQPKQNQPPVPLHFDPGLRSLRQHVVPPKPFWSEQTPPRTLSDEQPGTLSVKELVRFFRDPAAAYLKGQFQLNVDALKWEGVYEDEESWERPDALASWSLREQIWRTWLNVQHRRSASADIRQVLEGDLLLSPGQLGDELWRTQAVPLLSLLERSFADVKLEPQTFSRQIGGFTVEASCWMVEGMPTVVLSRGLESAQKMDLLGAIEACATQVVAGRACRVVSLKTQLACVLDDSEGVGYSWLEEALSMWEVGLQRPLPFNSKVAERYLVVRCTKPELSDEDALSHALAGLAYGDPPLTAAQSTCFNGELPAAPESRYASQFRAYAERLGLPLQAWLSSVEMEALS